MALPRRGLLIVLPILLAACSTPSVEVEGDVIWIDPGGATVVFDPSPDLGALSAVRAPTQPPSLLASMQAATRARLGLVRDGDGLVIVRVESRGASPQAVAGMHDHGPRHGGVVAALGDIHAEIVASPDGRVRLYPSDLHRAPLGVADTTGTVTLAMPDGPKVLTLVPAGDALEARGSLAAAVVPATVALVRDGQPFAVKVLLDLTGTKAGVWQMPETGCLSPQDATPRGPRCTIAFPGSFTAVSTSPHGERAIVSVAHGATSVWRLPEADVVMGLDPLPPAVVPAGAHEPDTRVMVSSFDGARIAVGAGNHVDVFDGATGRFLRQLDGPAGVIAALAWSSDGARLLTASAGDRKARMLDAATGKVVKTIDLAGVLAVALDSTGKWAAAATDQGTLALWDPTTDAPPRILTPSLQPIAALAFANDHLVTAGADRTLRIFDPTTATELARIPLAAAAVALAISPDAHQAAIADADRVITLHDLPTGKITATLTWHKARIGILAFGQASTLLSGDNDGTLAVWDLRNAAD